MKLENYFTQALGITKEENGLSLLGNKLYIENTPTPTYEISTSSRINIDYAEEATHFPWRFYLKNHPNVSK